MKTIAEIETALKFKHFLSVRDIAQILSVSRSTAYNIFRLLVECDESLKIVDGKRKMFRRVHKAIFLDFLKQNCTQPQ